MIRVCCRAGCHHAGKVSSSNGIGGGTAQTFAGVFPLDAALGQGQAAGAHGAVFTADTLNADGAGFHLFGAVKNSVNTQLLGALDHLLSGGINGRANRVRQLGGFVRRFGFGFVCH